MSLTKKIMKYVGITALLTTVVLAQDLKDKPMPTEYTINLAGISYNEDNIYILGSNGKIAYANQDIDKIKNLLEPNMEKEMTYIFNPAFWNEVPSSTNPVDMKIYYEDIKVVNGKRINK
ncbi:MAG: hypothetical protein ABIB43_02025 [archaeon]